MVKVGSYYCSISLTKFISKLPLLTTRREICLGPVSNKSHYGLFRNVGGIQIHFKPPNQLRDSSGLSLNYFKQI